MEDLGILNGQSGSTTTASQPTAATTISKPFVTEKNDESPIGCKLDTAICDVATDTNPVPPSGAVSAINSYQPREYAETRIVYNSEGECVGFYCV